MEVTWCKAELPERSFPITAEVMQGYAGLAIHWGFVDVALVILVAFHCLLRTGEAVSMRKGDFVFSSNMHFATLNLPLTKSFHRSGVPETVSIDDSVLILVLKQYLAKLQPGDTVLKRSGSAFRQIFTALTDSLGLSDIHVMPYSLRRGGATAHFRLWGSLDKTCLRGRWAHHRTARIYINTALQDLTAYSIPSEAQAIISSARNTLAAFGQAAQMLDSGSR